MRTPALATLTILVLFTCLGVPSALAQVVTCDTDCDDSCRIDLGPLGSVVEPGCRTSCEIHKRAACEVGVPVPDPMPRPPGPPSGATIFDQITGLAMARCSNWDGRLDDQHLIGAAIRAVSDTQLIGWNEFDGVQVRWCPLDGAKGLAPQNNRVYLDVGMKSAGLADLGALLVHEMTHIRQYRRMGHSAFASTYSQQYLACGGCQDRGHPLEREAYEAGQQARTVLAQRRPEGLPPGATLLMCGCHGAVMPGQVAPAPECSTGQSIAVACQGFCYGGGVPWGIVCR